ncbi:MAG TPA: RNA-processing protein [Thermoplasmatales archaeon]|nr:RNA-processing protein [Thermoplasmatales archaeon]
MIRYIKIPMERVAVLIGHKGETKRSNEEKTKIKIDVDSKQGEVTINDMDATDDPLLIFKVENIVRAIGRGFNPTQAMTLLDDEMDFYIFDIHDYVGKKQTHVRRLKGRVIGKNGKTKRLLEELTDSYISIYGHTISIIANVIDIDIVKKAVDKLLTGSKHATVYRFVETSMKKIRLEHGF